VCITLATRKTYYANAYNALHVPVPQTCDFLYCSEAVDICAWRRTLQWCCLLTDFVFRVATGHSPAKTGKLEKSEFKKEQKSGKVSVMENVFFACGQLSRVLFLTQNMQETSSLLNISFAYST